MRTIPDRVIPIRSRSLSTKRIDSPTLPQSPVDSAGRPGLQECGPTCATAHSKATSRFLRVIRLRRTRSGWRRKTTAPERFTGRHRRQNARFDFALNFVDPAKAHPVGDFRRKTEIVRTRFPEQKGRDAALRMTTSLYARWKPGRGQARFCAREKDAGLKPGATLKAKEKADFS